MFRPGRLYSTVGNVYKHTQLQYTYTIDVRSLH